MCESVNIDKKLPKGVPLFGAFRKDNLIYVDKTRFFSDIIDERYVFLARPRRFGKSLLLSTFSALFREGVSAVEGLSAAKEWKLGCYPVIELDFSDASYAKNADDFAVIFDALLQDSLKASGFQADDPLGEAPDPIRRWRRFLMSLETSSVVVLIDEYDAPLTAHLHEEEIFKGIRLILEAFFSTTKRYSGNIRFLFVTGIMKFRQASLFSKFNNITDISLDPRFGELTGYTEEELHFYFDAYVEKAAGVLGMSKDKIYSELKQHYDGFCFDDRAQTHVYAPWSVLSFLSAPSYPLKHYWFDSAGVANIIVNYLKTHKLMEPEEFDREHTIYLSDLSSSDDIDDLDATLLLTHTGYLTIKSSDGTSIQLGYPNEEVREAFASLYRTSFWPDREKTRLAAMNLQNALIREDIPQVMHILNGLVHQLDYQNFQIGSEAAVRQLVQVFCLGGGLPARAEVHSPRGRSDLELDLNDTNVVFEFKFAQTAEENDKLLNVAKKQLKEKDYGYAISGNRLLRIAMVFSRAERKFVLAAHVV